MLLLSVAMYSAFRGKNSFSIFEMVYFGVSVKEWSVISLYSPFVLKSICVLSILYARSHTHPSLITE